MQDLHTLISRKFARKNLAGFDLQGFWWSIGESNPVSLHCVRSVRFATVVCLPCRSADSFAHQASASLYPPLAALGSAPLQCIALSSARMRTLRARINKSGHPLRVSGLFVEHRGVEPLTSTMRMSRATNCANAPYRYPDQSGSASSTLTSRGLGRGR